MNRAEVCLNTDSQRTNWLWNVNNEYRLNADEMQTVRMYTGLNAESVTTDGLRLRPSEYRKYRWSEIWIQTVLIQTVRIQVLWLKTVHMRMVGLNADTMLTLWTWPECRQSLCWHIEHRQSEYRLSLCGHFEHGLNVDSLYAGTLNTDGLNVNSLYTDTLNMVWM